MKEALELIHQYAPVGGMVMDLFAGTCVTAMATLRLNRKCVCVERDQNVVTQLSSVYSNGTGG